MGLLDFMKMLNDPAMDQRISAATDHIEYYGVLLQLVAERLGITQKEIEERVDLKRKVKDNGEMPKMRRADRSRS